MSRLLTRVLLVAVGATLLTIAAASPASAHERRTVGAVQFVVGWGDEPSYSGFKNSVQLTLSEANGGPPITDLGDTLRVEVIKGSDRTNVPLRANFRVGAFGTPGDYRAWLAPTRPGTYTFHVTGSIRGQQVDESFTSSPTTFNDVEDVTAIQFPAKDPSTGQLATRIDRAVPRLEDDVDGARRTAVAGAILGLLGLAAGGAALVLSARGRARQQRREDGTPSEPAEKVDTLSG